LIGTRISTRVFGGPENISGRVRQKNFNQSLPETTRYPRLFFRASRKILLKVSSQLKELKHMKTFQDYFLHPHYDFAL